MKILIVLTGGTFGSIMDTGRGLKVAEEEYLQRVVNDVIIESSLDLNFKLTTPFCVLSEEMTPFKWRDLAVHIQEELTKERYDAILIIHGTDTMSYTGSALGYVFNTLDIPLVITGANYPLFEKESDAKNNFIKSLHFARWGSKNGVKGTFIVFSGYKEGGAKIHLACRSKKDKWEEYCYRSYYIGKGSLGSVKDSGEVEFNWEIYEELLKGKKDVDLRPTFLYENFVALKLYPGLPVSMVESLLNKGNKYFLLEIYNSGTAPALIPEFGFVPFVKKVTEKGGLVFAVSQHEGGRGASMDIYSTSIDLRESGLIPLKDMLWESAIPKIMLALGNFTDNKEIKEFLLTNIAGEIRSGRG